MPPPLYLMRHGQTEWNVARRMQGRLDSPLTALGRVQAARQGTILRREGLGTATVLVSPRGRARLSAALAGLRARVEPDLAEISMGAWEGQIRNGADQGVLWKFAAPDGDRQADLIVRLRRLIARLDGPTILVTHGVICIGLRALLTGVADTEWDRLQDPQGVVHKIVAGQDHLLR